MAKLESVCNVDKWEVAIAQPSGYITFALAFWPNDEERATGRLHHTPRFAMHPAEARKVAALILAKCAEAERERPRH